MSVPPHEKPSPVAPEAGGRESDEDAGSDRYQYSLRRLFLLTTVCAAFLAGIASIDLGGISPVAQFVARLTLAVYLINIAMYAVLRLPHECRGILRKTPEWRRLRARRAELVAMVEARRMSMKRPEAPDSPDDSDQRTGPKSEPEP